MTSLSLCIPPSVKRCLHCLRCVGARCAVPECSTWGFVVAVVVVVVVVVICLFVWFGLFGVGVFFVCLFVCFVLFFACSTRFSIQNAELGSLVTVIDRQSG